MAAHIQTNHPAGEGDDMYGQVTTTLGNESAIEQTEHHNSTSADSLVQEFVGKSHPDSDINYIQEETVIMESGMLTFLLSYIYLYIHQSRSC